MCTAQQTGQAGFPVKPAGSARLGLDKIGLAGLGPGQVDFPAKSELITFSNWFFGRVLA
jgi:hypothetical protein